MAVFGRDFYGLAKYGADVQVEFDVSPFVALSTSYNAIYVSWNAPHGNWTRLRLIKSRYGYAANENDGQVVLETTPPGDTAYKDEGLVGGAWYYYTLFIEQGGAWYRAGSTSAISLRDTGISALLWEKIPRYYRYVRRRGAAITDEYHFDASIFNPDQLDTENQHLRQFLTVMGWGLDYLRNFQETLLQANDARTTHLENLDRLAKQLGTEYSYAVPARVSRSKIANAGLLARRRGTLDGLRDVATLSTGWEVDIEVGPNIYLSPDQAEFANPNYPEWDSGVNYAVGQRTQYAGRIMQAQVGAYGYAQRPPIALEGDSNTWWILVKSSNVELTRDPATGAISTWKGWDGNTEKSLALGVGISSPFDTTVTNSNALKITNATTGLKTYDVWGAANLLGSTSPTPGRGYVVRQGIPIPHALQWDQDEEYVTGDYVVDAGVAWRALAVSTGLRPRDTPDYWEQVGIDDRPKIGMSFYGHGPTEGTAGTGSAAVDVGPAFFDDRGNLLIDYTNYTWTGVFFDTFNVTGTWAQRTPDLTYASEKWTTNAGTWEVWDLDDGSDRVAYPTSFGTPGAVTTVPSPSGVTKYWVAVTFGTPARSGRADALVIRYVDANNYLRITRTAIQRVAAGSVASTAAITPAIADGDRVAVLVDDTAGTCTVSVNGTQIASGVTLPTGTAPYQHGLMVV